MTSPKPHAMMVDELHDEHARMGFVSSFKGHLTNEVSGGSRFVYEGAVKPAAQRKLGREPTRHEIRRMIAEQPYYQMSSSLRRTSQEMIWDSAGECVERQWGELRERADCIIARPKKKGSLRLKPDLDIPRYLSAVDIHCMPGSYQREMVKNDVFAGAMYDRGVHMYRAKPGATLNDRNGRFMVSYLKESFPALKPRRILDMGCGVGASTVPYAEAWPQAEVHAIDIGGAMVRYGHARAESIGVPLHFSQQNAAATDFPDGHFDLIVSFLLLHETANQALRRIFKESHRMLAKGGVMVHVDSLPYAELSPWDQFVPDWDTHYNAEPFMGTLHDLDLHQLARDAGFKDSNVFEHRPRHPGHAPVITGTAHSNDGNVNGEHLHFGAVRD